MFIKSIVTLLLLTVALLTPAIRAGAQAGYTELRLIYVDNSREKNGDSYSEAAKAYIMKTMEGLVADNSTNMLFFYSNGDAPEYDRTQQRVMGMMRDLMDKTTERPNSLKDKQRIRSALYKGRLDFVTRISIDMFVTDYTLTEELLGEHPGYFVNFLPRELQYISKCSPSSITVNIHYPNHDNNINATDMQQRLAFCQGWEGNMEGISYNLREMRLGTR